MAAPDDLPSIEELRAMLALELGTDDVDLVDVAALLAETVASEPPQELRVATLDTALRGRPAGRDRAGIEPATPAEAFAGFVADLKALLDDLADADWVLPAHDAYGAVHDLVAHLAGVEEITLGWCGARDEIEAADHVAATRASIEALAATAGSEVAARWYALAREVERAAAAADPERPVLAHDIPTDVDGALVLRSFELWSHADDIRRATGRPVPAPDPAAMALMSERLMRVAALALMFRGVEAPAATVRWVLTGAGGGTYPVDLVPGGGPEVTIVADVVDVCRVAARRLTVDALDWALDGDPAVAELVLAHIDAFAKD